MIQKLIFPLFALLFLCTAARAQDTLQQGENAYRNGQFSAALSAYEQALKTHPNDPFVYYNIGNCYFKMGRNGLAAANYYRAFKLDPRDGNIRNNLSLALAAGGERLVPAGMPVVLHQTFYWLSYNELKGLFFILLWFSCTAGAVFLVKRKFGKTALAAIVVALLCAGWFYLRYQAQNQTLAVIASSTAQLRSGPGSNFPASANIAEGHLVTVLDKKDAWYEVAVNSQGIKGWVEYTALEKI